MEGRGREAGEMRRRKARERGTRREHQAREAQGKGIFEMNEGDGNHGTDASDSRQKVREPKRGVAKTQGEKRKQRLVKIEEEKIEGKDILGKC